jgi:hypothetical protein
MNGVGKGAGKYKQENKFSTTNRIFDATGEWNEQLRAFLERRGYFAMVKL